MVKVVILMMVCFSVDASEVPNKQYKKLQWVDLMPKEDVEALYNPPEEIMNIPEGSEGDKVANDVFNALTQASDSDYQRALSSTKVITALNEKNIQIPGFIVPVVIEGDKTTEFFIVPYFGACIHYPPPPPNQTIYAVYKKGYGLDKIYEPYNFSGLLTTSIKGNELATAAYHLNINAIDIYAE